MSSMQPIRSGAIKLELAPDGVMLIELNRPPVNALDNETRKAIRDVFNDLHTRRRLAAAILTGAGKVFCAGADIKVRDTDGADDPLDPGRLWRETLASVTACPVPLVAAINGPAIGAGVALASACDVILASTTATFALKEIDVGLLGGASHLMRMVGRYKTRYMMYTGESVGAEEFYRLGAVHAIVAPDALRDTALALARQIALKSPIALRLAKESLNRAEEIIAPYDAAYRVEQDYTQRLGTFDDSREARQAFLEKRTPNWKRQ